jgi:hypothetical protein
MASNRRARALEDFNEHLRSEIRNQLHFKDPDVIRYADFEALKEIYHDLIDREFNYFQYLLLNNGKMRDHPRHRSPFAQSDKPTA